MTIIEKRNSRRQRVLKRGILAFGGGGIDCTVRNISTSGARIDVETTIGLPPSFLLVIESDRLLRRCHTVWTTDRRVGLAFD